MLDPLQIFNDLDKSKSDIEVLRKAQEEILNLYYKEYKDESRIGLKLPTGSGKSLIAILILEAWRRSGKKVAIMCANRGLADDMKKRCNEINIPSETIFGAGSDPVYKRVRFRNLLRYNRSQIIGIFNYHSFLYGFESSSSRIQTPDILVIDDASDFETVRNDFYTLRIFRYKSLHKNTYNAIINKLLEYNQCYPNILGFKNRTTVKENIELILYPHQQDIISIIHNYYAELKDDTEFFFSYQRNQNNLSKYLIFISQNEVEIRPLIYPDELSQFSTINQIIYMSATLPDEELLHKIYGISKTIIMMDEKTISDKAYLEIETIGKRLIFPISLDPLYQSVDAISLDATLQLTKMHKKSLILVNSTRHANQIRHYLEANSITAQLYQSEEDSRSFSEKENGALICANRYFGLDFPSDTCTLGIIIKLPVVWDSIDAFQLTVLKNSSYIEQRIGNRLTQALGRCNRLIGDEALYYILDSRLLATITGDPQYLRYLPRNIYAEMMAGYYISLGDIEEAIKYGKNSFFGIDDEEREQYIDEEKELWLPGVPDMFTSKYDIEIVGWYKILSNAFSEAGNSFNQVADYYIENVDQYPKENLNILAAWNYYLSSFAYYNAYLRYKNDEDKNNCLTQLEKSIKVGSNSSWFNNLQVIYNELIEDKEKQLSFDPIQIEARRIKEQIALYIDDFIARNTTRNKDWKKAYKDIQIILESGTHSQMIIALETLFELLGYVCRRGNNQKGEPDLIILSSQTYNKHQLSVEVKTRQNGSEEGVESIRQCIGDSLIIKRRRQDYETIPILITQKESFTEKALETAIMAATLISINHLNLLIEKLYRKIDQWNNLDQTQKWYYIDSLISPYELYPFFRLQANPLINFEELS